MSSQQPVNPWNYKPWWCQPWSILLTGALIIAGSWAVTRTAWVTLIISLPILAWWTYFLIFWPRLVKNLSNPQLQRQSIAHSEEANGEASTAIAQSNR